MIATSRTRLGTRTLACVATLAVGMLALVGAAPALAEPQPHWEVIQRTAPKNLKPGEKGWITIIVINTGDGRADATAAHPLVFTDTLPSAIAGVGEVVSDSGNIEGMKGKASGGTNEVTLVEHAGESHEPHLACEPAPTLSCKYEGAISAGGAFTIEVPVEAKLTNPLGAGETKDLGVNEFSVSGAEVEGGAPVPSRHVDNELIVGEAEAPFGMERYELRPETESGAIDRTAGSHPFALTTLIAFNQNFNFSRFTTPNEGETTLPGTPELLRDLNTSLPAGLVGNTDPSVAPQCTNLQFSTVYFGNYNECPPETAIGVADVTLKVAGGVGYNTEIVPVFNLVPAAGEPARIGFEPAHVPVILDASVKTGKGYAVEVSSKNTSEIAEVLSTVVTVWGTPGAAAHRHERGWQCLGNGWRFEALGRIPECPASGPQPAKPYLTMPTTCAKPLESSLEADSWLPGAEFVKAPESPTETLTGCSSLPFSPSIEVQAEQHTADTPTGLKVTVEVPQASTIEPTEEETGKAEADIKETTVTFPEGVLANAGLANGLEACPAELVGFEQPESDSTLNAQLENDNFTSAAAKCPEASKIGTSKIISPLLAEPLSGSLYLARQDTSPFKSPLVLYLIAENKNEGVRVKLAGEVKLNQETGQLTSVFKGTPPVPFEKLELNLPNEEGGRASNTTPPRCGTYPTSAAFNTFSEEEGVAATTTTKSSNPASFAVVEGAGGGPCPPAAPAPLAFSPSFDAGSVNPQAGEFTPFTVTIGHADGQQDLESINTTLPAGMAALISEVEPCTEAQAEADACPPESKVGTTTSVSGLGGKPVTIGGDLYLTGALKANSQHGAGPFGLLAVTNAEHVGPFNLGLVNVFSTININPETAVATVQSGQIPKMIKGAPTQIKEINVRVERPGGAPFQFNPTNCNQLATTGALGGYEGGVQPLNAPFFAGNCSSLPFSPKITASVNGQGSKVNGVSFYVTIEAIGNGLHQANIHRVDLTLPKALPSRLDTIQKACPVQIFSVNPASCDEGSVVGEGIVHTPVFKNPLRGPAYLVGHAGAEFPDVEFVLQGEGVTIIADGKTFIENGITFSRFETNPDAPFSKFESIFPEGPHSALGVESLLTGPARNLCAQTLAIPTELEGQNGAHIKETTPVKILGCKGVLPSTAKKLTRAQELKKALAACKKKDKKNKKKRLACEKAAHKKWGPKKPAKKSSKKHSSKKK